MSDSAKLKRFPTLKCSSEPDRVSETTAGEPMAFDKILCVTNLDSGGGGEAKHVSPIPQAEAEATAHATFPEPSDKIVGLPWLKHIEKCSTFAEQVLRLHEIEMKPPQYGRRPAEARPRFKRRLRLIIEQMMYVSGEAGEPSVETTGIITQGLAPQNIFVMERRAQEREGLG